ncbi:MAG: nucleotidyltransferase domain-containing protein [Candidatus Omnitrophica bacterium]|nr:nucleotidyltransferase domain-containing protein [Candidatus Omnitrophota bacterium]
MRDNRGRQKLIRQIADILKNNYHPERIVLFGSWARGQAGKDSDIDLLIVKQTPLPFYRRLAEVRKLVSSVRQGVPFDPIVMTPEELGRRLRFGDRFLKNILQSGQVLYAGS